jgi:hypothetical protein
MYKFIALIIFALAFLVAISLTSFADSVDMNGDEAIYEAAQAIVPPKIDGVLDDAIWASAPSVTLGLINEGGTIEEEYRSTAWVVYDSEKIYFAFKNMVPNPSKIVVQHAGRDSDTWEDEENELFIEPNNVGAEPYFQFCINAECEIYDQESGGQATTWDAKSLQCASEIYDDYWVLEGSFAFEDLDVDEAPVGETWGWNFNRHIVADVDIWIGWSETGSSFHTQGKFGDIVFTREKLAVRHTERISNTWGRIKSSL